MSDKTPHWPGADGKPGVSFGPKSLPDNEGGKSAKANAGKSGSATPRLDAAKARETGAGKKPQDSAAKGQPGPDSKALAVPGHSNKQVSRTGEKQGKASSQSGKSQPQQGGKKPASGAKAAPQALPGPVAGTGQGKKPGGANPNQAPSNGRSAPRTPRPMPGQNRAALPGQATSDSGPAGAQQAAGGAAAAGDTAKATPWAATPSAGPTVKPSTTRDKSHSPEGRLSKVGEARRTRKARLRVSRVDPWSVMKTTFLFSIAFGIMLVVIVAVLWSVIAGSGALQSVNSTITQLIGDSNSQFNIEDYINAGRVIGFAAVLAALDVVIITAVSTLFAFLYNLAAAVIGGLEITLAED